MKTLLLSLAGAACLLWPVGASAQERELTPAEEKARDMRLPELDRTALVPEERQPETVQAGERNPFGLVALPPEEVQETEAIQAETEEMRLRRILGNMRVTGVSGAAGSYRIVLGSMLLKQGELLPKLFADQAEVLRVSDISDREVVLSFVEKDPSIPARSIGLGYDLQPRPQSLMPGEIFSKLVPFTPKGASGLQPLEVPAVQAITQGAEASGLHGLTERSFQLMGEPVFRADENEQTAKED
jgi:hypothetical protein